MAEPHTTSFIVTATAASLGVSTLFPGIDGNALIGAFAGSSLVAISSKNLPLLQRVAYMLISFAVGYLAAPEVVSKTPLHESGVAAFLAAAAAIAVTLHLIDLIKTIQLPQWLQKGRPRD
ncbi:MULTISPECIES: putative holin [unclassified Undibacterium]|uniref:putative holin n=1 Tax=unclassified Undibacterium TaxID=2630295 RepID=UPI002AC8D6D9|nr:MULTISPECIES: putative holin [unclassified Undibacterium]MEB0138004.1 putative holin [Undibacterium sp. CCC2.1]MEB0170663.1 putative holin [Undibacterium sp. CCC1.1]MEB0177004.1 putative holin [Undibacterium sp. CCC3.4]MEB0216292.1 putative holin [Undibacterium sp. 5I2]WPX42478.1 putative holin [Undibacterium sp. CCC3.4]